MKDIQKPISTEKIPGTPLVLKRFNSGFWNVTFDNPPLNLFDPEMLSGLSIIVDRMELDPDVKVIVFDSALENFFIAHFDVLRGAETPPTPTASGLPLFIDITQRLLKSPVISIAAIRGRARGIGIEFAVACDMRFASREKAILGQLEVGVSVIPGGGSMENVPALVGRARALELIIGAEDIPADVAERYGLINRALPDAEFEDFVFRFAWRISQFDKHVIGLAKASIIKRSGGGPKVEDLVESRNDFWRTLQREEAKPVFRQLFEWGLQKDSDFELNIGAYLNRWGEQPENSNLK